MGDAELSEMIVLTSPRNESFAYQADAKPVAPEAESHRSFLVLFFKKEPLPHI